MRTQAKFWIDFVESPPQNEAQNRRWTVKIGRLRHRLNDCRGAKPPKITKSYRYVGL